MPEFVTIKICQSNTELEKLMNILSHNNIEYMVKESGLSKVNKKLTVLREEYGKAVWAIKKAI